MDTVVEWLLPLCMSMRANDDVPPECCSTSSAALLTARPYALTLECTHFRIFWTKPAKQGKGSGFRA